MGRLVTRNLTTEDVRSAVLNEGDGGITPGWTEAEFNAWLDTLQSEWYDAGYDSGISWGIGESDDW